ncbi:putative nuclease HARBI1 [Harpegnathos saltator]|uniref:putative nuclease HARBI1 n=1 Tax=Harpegnathos saltator TaxID=610380 RepID=UPI000DBEDC58|nr:putative nuclease HARBI1 [Harpegnathos saltator]
MMDFLCDIARNVIKFSDKENTANEFLQIAGFPKVLGCIDGTFIKVRTPAHKIKSTYVNRHDIPSITLQGICDARKRFIDTFTGIPSKIHDARVLKLSDICDELLGICEGGKYHILGDGAYPIRKWLIIPFKDYGNLSAKDNQFNKMLSATRVLI